MIEGLLGQKLGMTTVFNPDGTITPVTVIEAGPCYVTQIKTEETDGYTAVQIGFGAAKRLSQAERGHLKGTPPVRHLREVPATDLADLSVGKPVTVEIFRPGEMVNVTGISKGKGFAGGVKRHHFKGGPRTHGQSDRHRAPGSIGSTTTPGRVFKGLRMAGRMGGDQVTVKNLLIVRTDPERNLLLVAGAVPGPRNGLVMIRRAR